MKTALTIAGSDPSGGAGLQADLRVFRDFGLRGLSVVTALTAQNRRAVKAVLPVDPEFVARQATALLEEFTVDAVKIGMLACSDTVRAVKGFLMETDLARAIVVLDTVLVSTSGFPLLETEAIEELKSLIPLATAVTPNIEEAETLSGVDIKSPEDMERAAGVIAEMGAEYVVIKGGHLKGRPTDLLHDGKGFFRFESGRLRGSIERFHGTGCRFSSALTAGLAKGWSVKRAVKEAKGYVERTIRSGW